MPHVIVKMFPGRSEDQKRVLAEALTADIMKFLGTTELAVSVAFEEVPSQDWTNDVYNPDIKAKWDTLYKKPGYEPK